MGTYEVIANLPKSLFSNITKETGQIHTNPFFLYKQQSK